mmetsp:Transcript_30598/g.60146  ORF Transcript_30598/g.60146 Transcript_30598/m.60146 type:complete len:87 (+) Transcript_30598:802-1062(+)
MQYTPVIKGCQREKERGKSPEFCESPKVETAASGQISLRVFVPCVHHSCDSPLANAGAAMYLRQVGIDPCILSMCVSPYEKKKGEA